MTSAPSADQRPDADPPVLRLDNVSLEYPRGPLALDGITLRVDRGERVGVVGQSGAGKSSLISLINGRALFDGARVEGDVEVLGTDPSRLGASGRRRLGARVGTVRQALDLVGPMQVGHNVAAGRLAHWSTARALWALLRPRHAERAGDALRLVGLDPSLASARVDELSGGQQQRVAVARLLVQAPELALADEPISSLDPELSAVVLELLARPPEKVRWTLVASVHRLDLATRFIDRLVGLRDGRIEFDAPVAEVDEQHLTALYRR